MPHCGLPGLATRRRLATAFALAFAAGQVGMTVPATACRENAMLVFDASGSMDLFRDGRSKIELARKAAADVLPDITRYRPTGLVTYGGGQARACADVMLQVTPRVASGDQIIEIIRNIKPNGATPLSDGVRLAVQELERRGGPGVVVVVTDGVENCGQRTCRLADEISARNAKIRVHVISFFLHGRRIDTLTCLTEKTNGVYTAANSLESLRDALHELLSCHRTS